MANFSVLNYWRSHRHFEVAAVILIVIGLAWSSEGLRMCYHCNTSSSGLECVHNPSNVTDGEISCKGYCTIRREEYAYRPENANLISLQRSCEVVPQFYDEIVLQSYFKIYFRTCKSYLFNRGSGKESLRHIPVDPAWDLYTDDDGDTNGVLQNNPITTALYLSSLSLVLTLVLPCYFLIGR